MATKEDILEQIVEEYLLHEGYFVRHNIKFLPRKTHYAFDSKSDSNHSDIDVIGFHPQLEGPRRVMVVSCKSWQNGFNVRSKIDEIDQGKIVGGRNAWKAFREITNEKWTEGFFDAVRCATGSEEFTYVTAVTKVIGDKKLWERNAKFKTAMRNNPIVILTLAEMIDAISRNQTKTLAATEVGRLLQLFKSADLLQSKS